MTDKYFLFFKKTSTKFRERKEIVLHIKVIISLIRKNILLIFFNFNNKSPVEQMKVIKTFS